ncbi:MAG: DoxX family protein [Conexivisphaerales archaeon]
MLEIYTMLLTAWLLIFRIIMGGTLMHHGYPKLQDGAKQAGKWMNSMGIPSWTATLAMILEFFGGILLIAGFLTRLISAFIAVFMISNVIMKKIKMNASYVAQDKPSYEVDVLYLLLAVTLIIIGPGIISIDHLIGLA